MNALNKKLSAMGLKSVEAYIEAFRAFNEENISKPQAEDVPAEGWSYPTYITNNYQPCYSDFVINGSSINGFSHEFKIGEKVEVRYLLNGSGWCDTCIINETGYKVIASVCDMAGYRAEGDYKDGLYLYPGVRQEFFSLVGLPDCGTSHQVFDMIVEKLHPHNYY